MIDFSVIFEKVQDFLSEKRKPLLISCILILFFCSALIIVAFNSPKEYDSPPAYHAEPLVAEDELLLPQGPSVPQSYVVTREKKEKWDSKEIERWFSEPDEAAVERLSESNDEMISDVLGAAP